MPTSHIYEIFQRSVQLEKTRTVYQRGWKFWSQDDTTLQLIPIAVFSDLMSIVASKVSIGDAYPGATNFVCNNIEIDEGEDGELHIATASYEIDETPPDDFEDFINRSSGGSGSDDPNNPFRPRRSGGGMTVEEYRWKDIAGKAFVNAAKQRFTNIPPITVTIQVDRITVVMATRADTSAQGKCAGRLLLSNVTYEEKDHKNKQTGVLTRYYENTYEVWTHPDHDWDKVEVLNTGFKIIKNGKLIAIKDPDTGEVLVEESNLSEDGTGVLAPGTPPNTIEFTVRHATDLNIPFFP